MKICIISAYIDPIHPGHVEYIKKSKEIAGKDGKLVVIVNNDDQAILKKGKAFMPCDDRIIIVQQFRDVDEVVKSIDKDRTVCATIQMLHKLYTEQYDKPDIWFLNGGDAFNNKIPERPICESLGIQLLDGLGDKIRSSSWLTGLKPL